MRIMRLTALAIAVILAAFIGVNSTTASAESGPQTYTALLQQEIQKQLEDTHGGTQISPNEVSYERGNVIVVFPDASGKVPTSESLRPASPDTFYEHGCPGGATQTWYCFFADRD